MLTAHYCVSSHGHGTINLKGIKDISCTRRRTSLLVLVGSVEMTHAHASLQAQDRLFHRACFA